MLTFLIIPVLGCMHFLEKAGIFAWTTSYHIGRAIFLALVKLCNFLMEILAALAVIGEELYQFIFELNKSISAVSNYISTSANGGVNCAIEAALIFCRNISKFFSNTKLHSKLLASKFGIFLCEFFTIIRNALLLLADCAWWIITLVPKLLGSLLIAVGDAIVWTITFVRLWLVYTVAVIVEDIFRLTIGLAMLIVVWNKRRHIGLLLLQVLLHLKRLVRVCACRVIAFGRHVFRRRGFTSANTPNRVQRRFPLPRPSVSPPNKVMDPQQRCVICRDRQKCVLLLPCRHLCLCEECADHMLNVQRQNCPLCRSDIVHSMSVYI